MPVSTTTFVPETIESVRALLAGDETLPTGVFSEVIVDTWKASVSRAGYVNDPISDYDIVTPNLSGTVEAALREKMAAGDPLVRMRAIDLALHETFQVLADFERADRGFDVGNISLFRRFEKAVFDEMEALLAEWDHLTGNEVAR